MARRGPRNGWRALFATLLFCFCLIGIGAPAARADDLMWGGLLILENPAKDGVPFPPAKLPPALAGREKQIAKIFGYKGLRIIGQAQQKIKTGEEDWLVPSKRFFVKVDTKNPIPNGYLVGLQLYQDDKLLVEATVKLARDNPLYIRGPQVGNGQLIIALVTGKESAWQKVKPPAAKPVVTPVAGPSLGPTPAPARSPAPTAPTAVPEAPKPSPSPATVPTG